MQQEQDWCHVLLCFSSYDSRQAIVTLVPSTLYKK